TALCHAFFAYTGGTELAASARTVNPASRRVLETCGFVQAGSAPMHMNSFTPTVITGTPGSLWKCGTALPAIRPSPAPRPTARRICLRAPGRLAAAYAASPATGASLARPVTDAAWTPAPRAVHKAEPD
ncbi:GNAT family N-acetyltransferase, partial [Methylobacterium organophilum]|nr:GNAT family N-acetyltransferase [Methylobacterium organophilum]